MAARRLARGDERLPLGLVLKLFPDLRLVHAVVEVDFGMWISVVIGDPGVNDDRQF
ncbi:hypothetical protein JK364_23865 [Streptomyces sp. 110]|uniref:Uncharacterized protein n=1 Tax=Streptomyces endocoffeicus TaxID=2898945 RepID=A0ABS1PSK2_9ACTN|nr:hypothetical protein [Streptomyces endocoffeicus]MBL1115411.1 hypothetical protein [Streptomyces endocoffeicus]